MEPPRALSCLWIGVAVLAATLCYAGASSADVFRLLQAELAGKQIGAKHYSAEGYLTLPLSDVKPFKAVMVLPVNTTTPEVLAEYTQQKSLLSGVLLVLPKSADSAALSAADASQLLKLEQQLLAAPAAVPVFFTQETAALAAAVSGTKAMFERGAPPTRNTDRYDLTIQGKLPAQLVAKQAMNYVASLRATDDQFKPGVPVAPTLLLTASFDSFSLAPAAPAGADSAASGAAACLLLLRLLHRMYASPESRPSRNVVVLLTSGAPYGQQGLKQWAADIDPALLEATEAAIVLDSIGASIAVQQQQQQQQQGSSSQGSEPQLRLHHAGSSSSQSWVEAITAAASRVGVSVTPVKQEIAAESESSEGSAGLLGHEHLVRRGVPAVSLSYLSAPPGVPRVSSLADTAAGVDLDKVLEAAQVTADAVSRWLYPGLDPQLRLIDLAVEPGQHRDFLAGWIDLLTTATSMMPFDKADPASVVHDSLHQFLRSHSHSTKRHVWSPAGTAAGITAWSGTTAHMQVHQAAGFHLDMVLTASVVMYLVTLYFGLVLATRGYTELKAIWSPKPTRRSSRSNSKRYS